jgi:hypothetical protein
LVEKGEEEKRKTQKKKKKGLSAQADWPLID